MDEDGGIRETYGFDEFGLSFNDHFEKQLQPFGFTGYQMEAVGGLYFAQVRRYDAGVGRFVSEDIIKGFITAPYTMNVCAYCFNMPLGVVDLDGAWPSWSDVQNVITKVYDFVGDVTIGAYDYVVDKYLDLVEDWRGTVSIKSSANFNILLGEYIDIGHSYDWKGNVSCQMSYAVPFVDDTMSVGVADIGIARGIAFTDAEDVNGLLEKSSSMGVSGGYLEYLTLDIISFDEIEDRSGDINGFQVGFGYGAGIDVHLLETYTREIWTFNIFQSIRETLQFLFRKGKYENCIEPN